MGDEPAAADNDVLASLVDALGARLAVDEGRYCECTDPDLRGVALMCFRCKLRNRNQEIARIHLIADAHAFEPQHSDDEFMRAFCVFCVRLEDDPRHHGTPSNGRTSWGVEVVGEIGDPAVYQRALTGEVRRG